MRVTVDIDGSNKEWWAWSVFYMMKHSKLFTAVEIYRTRRGYHIIGYGSSLTESQVSTMRRIYGDDTARIEIDQAKNPNQPKQVLWTVKNGHTAKLLERWTQ